MAKLPINPFLLLSARSYAVATENAKVQPVATAMRKAAAAAAAAKEEVFWMRDPKTGNWVPETHFVGDGQIDAAELREKLLSKKRKSL